MSETIAEASRVLKSGGIIGITVIGRPENCNFQLAHAHVMTEEDEHPDCTAEEHDDPHEIGSRPEVLAQRLRDYGFERVFHWYTSAPSAPAISAALAVKAFEQLQQAHGEQSAKRHEEIERVVEETLGAGRIFSHEELCVVARKS